MEKPDDIAGQPEDELQEAGADDREDVHSPEVSPQPRSARSTNTATAPSNGGPVGKSIMNLSTLRCAPQYSFRVSKDRFSSRAQTAAAQVPGPGAYSTSTQVTTSRHKCSPRMVFGTSGRETKSRQIMPGPGAYAGAATSFVGKGSAFSVTPRRGSSGVDVIGRNDAPGPGSHDVPGIIGESGPMYSASPRTLPLRPDNYRGPGPGEYGTINEVHNKLKQTKEPSWGFGTSKRQGGPVQDDRIVPGVRGKSTAAGLIAKLPGPGSYNSHTTVGEGPKFSLGARRPSCRKQVSPGPGETAGPFTTFGQANCGPGN